jgi:hypothetical protein
MEQAGRVLKRPGILEIQEQQRSGDRVTEVRPVPAHPTENSGGEGNENLHPQPSVCLSLAKPLDEIACQCAVVIAWTRVH